jgi:hypothetical protein
MGDQQATVSVYVMSDVAEQRKVFGTEMTSRGLVPLWLAVRNKTDSGMALALDPSDVRLTQGSRSRTGRNAAANPEPAGTVDAASVPTLSLADHARLTQTELRRQLSKQIIEPGATSAGFVYAAVDPSVANPSGWDLTLMLRRHPSAQGDAGTSYTLPAGLSTSLLWKD